MQNDLLHADKFNIKPYDKTVYNKFLEYKNFLTYPSVSESLTAI